MQEIPGISNVVIEPVGSSGVLAVTVESAAGQDARSEIAAKIVGKGWPLLELRGVSLSLEEIFLQLTTDDASHAVESNI
jgi:ABC-2 type transport system ATP-binding protein